MVRFAEEANMPACKEELWLGLEWAQRAAILETVTAQLVQHVCLGMMVSGHLWQGSCRTSIETPFGRKWRTPQLRAAPGTDIEDVGAALGIDVEEAAVRRVGYGEEGVDAAHRGRSGGGHRGAPRKDGGGCHGGGGRRRGGGGGRGALGWG
ncbi:hypothetical protein EJB05_08064 [Eragrostis curvula]|uniref:Uncharacterized protein n=1 Tax=Eragrostis curvula TaxID=38414 RepID=A0A5J9WJL8_9POAL|nr:hypothetical protein EJB05_08064 [Eragrostis curvula]